MTSDQETVCSQQCANRLKGRTVALSALIAEVVVKLRGYRCLVLLFRLVGGISFLLGLAISFVELVATNFSRIPMVETIILTVALLGVSAVSTAGARALDRQIRETQELLGGEKELRCGH